MGSFRTPFFRCSFLLLFSISTIFAEPALNRGSSSNAFSISAEARLLTDKSHYAKGESVILYGEGFRPFEDISLSVELYSNALAQDIAIMRWSVFASADGSFKADFPFDSLGSPNDSVFTIKAFGGDQSAYAEATISDLMLVPAANLDQCANGGVGDPPDPCSGAAWVNGNVNESKAHWFEGQSAAYRQILTGFTVGSTGNTVTIGYDTTKGGKHAFDYLTSFDRTETLAMGNNPCSGIIGCSLGTFTTFPIPVDPKVTAGFDQIPGNSDDIAQIPGVLTLFGGTITGLSGYTTTGTYAGDSHTAITITFTANSENMVLAWGGHVATRANWGTSNTAVFISGSPYHMLQDACSFGCGVQDRGLSSTAVGLNSMIRIIKQALPESAWVFNFTTTGTGLSPFTLVDDGVDNDATPNNISFINLLLPGTSGAFTVSDNFATKGPYTLTSITCSVLGTGGSTTAPNIPAGAIGITLQYGDTVTCTFGNGAVTAANVSVSGRVTDVLGNPVTRTVVTIQSAATGQIRTAQTNSFGYYRVDELPVGEFYLMAVWNRKYTFDPSTRFIELSDSVEGVDFMALPQ
jgi:hypothetical protein